MKSLSAIELELQRNALVCVLFTVKMRIKLKIWKPQKSSQSIEHFVFYFEKGRSNNGEDFYFIIGFAPISQMNTHSRFLSGKSHHSSS